MILNYGDFTQLNKRTLEDLGATGMVALVCPDMKVQGEAIQFISRLLIKEEDIAERQKIFKDIINNDILEELISINEKYEECKTNNTVSVKKYTALQASFESELALKILHLYVVMNGILSKCSFESDSLNQLKNMFSVIVNNDGFDKLGNKLHQLVNIRFADKEDYVVSIDSLSQELELFNSVSYANENDYSLIRKKHKLFQKKSEETTDFEMNSILTGLLEAKYKETCELISQYNKYALKIFDGLGRDVKILRFVCEYVSKMDNTIYPKVSHSIKTVISEYSDMLLSLKNMKCVKNDISLGKLMVIKGENSSGKTSYLKMIGMIQILSQVGLPIKCERADIHIYNTVETLFASGEKTLGRFEEEVRTLSELYECMSNNCLLLMNEVFQSTTYGEGRDALVDIMNAFIDKGADISLVTFFEDMDEVMSGQVNVRFGEGHKVEVRINRI